MPFDGSGNFNRVMNWTTDRDAGIKIRADRHDQEDDNIASGLSSVLTKDGQTQPTANLPMNGKKLVNLGSPTNPTDAATKGYVDADFIHGLSAKPVPVDADELLISNSESTPAWQRAKATVAALKATFTGFFIHPAPVKAALVDADEFAVADSVSTPTAWATKRHSWASLKEGVKVLVATTSHAFAIKQYFVGNKTGDSGMAVATPDLGEIEVRSNGVGAAMMAFHRANQSAGYLGIDTDNALKWGGWTSGPAAYRLLHEGLAVADLQSTAFIRQQAFPQEATTANYTPDADGGVGNLRYFVAPAGAWTLNAPGASPACFTMAIAVNTPGANTCTFAGFTKVTGAPMPTGSGLAMVYITRIGGYCTAFVERII